MTSSPLSFTSTMIAFPRVSGLELVHAWDRYVGDVDVASPAQYEALARVLAGLSSERRA